MLIHFSTKEFCNNKVLYELQCKSQVNIKQMHWKKRLEPTLDNREPPEISGIWEDETENSINLSATFWNRTFNGSKSPSLTNINKNSY
jgi:hypothetical protein